MEALFVEQLIAFDDVARADTTADIVDEPQRICLSGIDVGVLSTNGLRGPSHVSRMIDPLAGVQPACFGQIGFGLPDRREPIHRTYAAMS